MEAKDLPLLLIADDDEEDRMLIREAFEECGADVALQFTHDGEETIQYLQQAGCSSQSPSCCAMPDLLLVDLNMPRMNGFEVVRVLKNSPLLASLPIVVLTTGLEQEGRAYLQSLGVLALFIKPTSFRALCALVGKIYQLVKAPQVVPFA
jgi:CheY-like chemotaxis protein